MTRKTVDPLLEEINRLYGDLYDRDKRIEYLESILTDANNEIERLWTLCLEKGIDPGVPEIPF